MEWNKDQIKFLEENGYLIEKGDYDEFWMRTYGVLSPSQAVHLMLGVALVSELEIKVEVFKKSLYAIMTIVATADEIIVFKSRLTDLSDISIMEATERGLKYKGASDDLIAKVIGRMKVIRD